MASSYGQGGTLVAANNSFADCMISAATGLVTPPANMVVNTKFGRSAVIDTGDPPVDVWNNLSLYTGHPIIAGGVPVEVLSTDAGDNMQVALIGLDATGIAQNETLTLNGTTPVASALMWKRLPRAFIDDSTMNAGAIIGRDSATPANVFFRMPATRGQTDVAADTVPADKNMAITRFEFTSIRANGSPYSAEVTLRARVPNGVYRAIRTYGLGNGFDIAVKLDVPIVLPPLTDIVARVENVSDNDVTVTYEMDYFLYDI